MLSEGYIDIDGFKMTPSSFDYVLSAVENINQSEAGTDIVTVIRPIKYTFNMSWTGITAELLDKIEGFCLKNVVTLTYRNKKYICRARNAAPRLANKAYKYKYSDGIWDISITLTEI
ncbi:MAG: hypothetical protein NC393_08080 [Clostridium sp.]|nr:hypothetical protein [Clostridium sp.]MCM1207653.1 hypothetical protein [Ruminococcus sp.]